MNFFHNLRAEHLRSQRHQRPPACGAPYITSSTESSISVKWRVPDVPLHELKGFELQFASKFSGEWRVAACDLQQNFSTIGQLLPATAYLVRVRVRNQWGFSEFSVSQVLRTADPLPAQLRRHNSDAAALSITTPFSHSPTGSVVDSILSAMGPDSPMPPIGRGMVRVGGRDPELAERLDTPTAGDPDDVGSARSSIDDAIEQNATGSGFNEQLSSLGYHRYDPMLHTMDRLSRETQMFHETLNRTHSLLEYLAVLASTFSGIPAVRLPARGMHTLPKAVSWLARVLSASQPSAQRKHTGAGSASPASVAPAPESVHVRSRSAQSSAAVARWAARERAPAVAVVRPPPMLAHAQVMRDLVREPGVVIFCRHDTGLVASPTTIATKPALLTSHHSVAVQAGGGGRQPHDPGVGAPPSDLQLYAATQSPALSRSASFSTAESQESARPSPATVARVARTSVHHPAHIAVTTRCMVGLQEQGLILPSVSLTNKPWSARAGGGQEPASLFSDPLFVRRRWSCPALIPGYAAVPTAGCTTVHEADEETEAGGGGGQEASRDFSFRIGAASAAVSMSGAAEVVANTLFAAGTSTQERGRRGSLMAYTAPQRAGRPTRRADRPGWHGVYEPLFARYDHRFVQMGAVENVRAFESRLFASMLYFTNMNNLLVHPIPAASSPPVRFPAWRFESRLLQSMQAGAAWVSTHTIMHALSRTDASGDAHLYAHNLLCSPASTSIVGAAPAMAMMLRHVQPNRWRAAGVGDAYCIPPLALALEAAAISQDERFDAHSEDHMWNELCQDRAHDMRVWPTEMVADVQTADLFELRCMQHNEEQVWGLIRTKVQSRLRLCFVLPTPVEPPRAATPPQSGGAVSGRPGRSALKGAGACSMASADSATDQSTTYDQKSSLNALFQAVARHEALPVLLCTRRSLHAELVGRAAGEIRLQIRGARELCYSAVEESLPDLMATSRMGVYAVVRAGLSETTGSAQQCSDTDADLPDWGEHFSTQWNGKDTLSVAVWLKQMDSSADSPASSRHPDWFIGSAPLSVYTMHPGLPQRRTLRLTRPAALTSGRVREAARAAGGGLDDEEGPVCVGLLDVEIFYWERPTVVHSPSRQARRLARKERRRRRQERLQATPTALPPGSPAAQRLKQGESARSQRRLQLVRREQRLQHSQVSARRLHHPLRSSPGGWTAAPPTNSSSDVPAGMAAIQ